MIASLIAAMVAEREGQAADYCLAVAEAATYRQALLVALEGWELDRRKRLGAEERLRQLMGTEPWHRESDGDSSC